MDDKKLLQELSAKYAQPNPQKLKRALDRLERMASFYKDKLEVAPNNQAMMFEGFISSLLYASTSIQMYRKLTSEINKLAEEANDETGNQG